MIIQNSSYNDQILKVVVLRVGAIYIDLTENHRNPRNMYMLMYVNENKKSCQFLSLRKCQLYFEMCYEGLQIQQVT
jgi:hypothetical protein